MPVASPSHPPECVLRFATLCLVSTSRVGESVFWWSCVPSFPQGPQPPPSPSRCLSCVSVPALLHTHLRVHLRVCCIFFVSRLFVFFSQGCVLPYYPPFPIAFARLVGKHTPLRFCAPCHLLLARKKCNFSCTFSDAVPAAHPNTTLNQNHEIRKMIIQRGQAMPVTVDRVRYWQTRSGKRAEH